MPTVKPPSTLSAAGKALWKSVTSKYVLRPDEAAILEDACAAADVIAALDAAWDEDGRPMTTKGSMGQLVIHPLIGEIRQQRAFRDQALARLKFSDDEAPAAGVDDVTSKARKAAVARWSRGA